MDRDSSSDSVACTITQAPPRTLLWLLVLIPFLRENSGGRFHRLPTALKLHSAVWLHPDRCLSVLMCLPL